MSKVTAVKEAVKESLVGVEEPTQLSAHTKSRFTNNAVKDAETGELFMGADEFIKAVAPTEEDYVGVHSNSLRRELSRMDYQADPGFSDYSTRSSVSSTASSSAWPIARVPAALAFPNGLLSRTSS